MAQVLISERAKDELNALEPEVAQRIKDKLLDEVAAQPDRYLVNLTDRPDSRVRVGDYRVLCRWDKAEDVIKITKIEKRDTVYD